MSSAETPFKARDNQKVIHNVISSLVPMDQQSIAVIDGHAQGLPLQNYESKRCLFLVDQRMIRESSVNLPLLIDYFLHSLVNLL